MIEKLLPGALALAAAAAVTAGTIAPASAADTDVTFELSGGSLSVSAQAAANLGTPGGSGTTTVTGQLGNVVVTDNRGGTTGWSVGAATTAFGDGVTTASAVSYNSGVPSFTGVVTPVTRGATTLSATPAQVVSGTLVIGNNTATWNPTLTVTLPASSTAGTYTGTITTSLL